MRTQLNVRVPQTTSDQIAALLAQGYESQSHAVIVAVDRLYQREIAMNARNLTDNAWTARVNHLRQMVDDMNPAPTSAGEVEWWLTEGWADLDADDIAVLRREIERKYGVTA